MFQMDERSIADNRTLISVQPNKTDINTLNKNGTINFTSSDKELWVTRPEVREAFLKRDPHVYDNFDKILLARKGLTIEGNYEFKDDQKFLSNLEVMKNVIIRGDLSVLGQTTTIDTPTMTIEDNIIELNKNEKGEGITLRKSGSALNRGTKGFARSLYSEDHGGFLFDNSAATDGNIENWSLISLTEDNGGFKAGDLRVKSALHAIDGNFTRDINVANLTTTKNLNVTNALTVTGLSTFNGDIVTNGTLTTNGQVNFRNNITAYKPATFQDVTTFNANVIMNKEQTNNGLVTMKSGLYVRNSNLTVDTGTLQVGGAVTFDSTLGVAGNTTINGALSVNNIITSNNTITGNDFVTQSHYFVSGGDGHGIRFWDKSDKYTIFMSSTATTGQVEHANASDYNMYFKMTEGTNRGFVFANGANPITQIEGSGIIRTVNDIYSKNSRVLTQADEGEGNGIDADTVDNKHARDLLWRDGSLEMLGDLKLANHKLRFADDDFIAFDDNTININGTDRAGAYSFNADTNRLAVLDASVFRTGTILIDGYTKQISGLNLITGSNGQAFKMSDTWIRVNPNNDYTDGVYFNQSLIRTDKEIQIGSAGTVLRANNDIFAYKGQKVLTQAGIETMHGGINMGAQKIAFNANVNTGTGGTASSDYAYIYAEHDENSETSRLILDIADNPNDAIVLRTSNMADHKKDSFKIDYTKATFSDNPYFGSNRLLHTGDMGSGNHLDADTVDGKHYSDLVNDFVNATGDSMSGTLSMQAQNKITFGDINNEIRGGGDSNASLVVAAKDILFLRAGNNNGSNYSQLTLDQAGRFAINNIEIVNKSMYGHTKGINADMIDDLHLADLDNRFVNADGDTMTGNLTMSDGRVIIGAHNYGFKCKDSIGNSDYVLYLDANNAVHVGYNNRPIFLDYDNPTVRGNHKIWHAGNDGHGSGLDADTIDGRHLTDLDSRFVNAAGDTMTGPLFINGETPEITFNGGSSKLRLVANNTDSISYIQSGTTSNDKGKMILSGLGADVLTSFQIKIENLQNAKINNDKILTTADCGHGKRLDADTLDGRHGNDFAAADHNHDERYIRKNEVDLKNKYRIAYNESTNSLDFMYLG